MKSALISLAGFAALSLAATAASPADRLADGQLDLVAAGDNGLAGLNCPGCTLVSSSSTSNNGVTTTTSSTGVNTPPSSGGSSGGSGGSGGGTGGGGGTGTGTSVVIPLSSQSVFPAGAAAALQKLLGG